MDGLEADNRRAIVTFFKREVMNNDKDTEESLSTAQKNIENAAPNECTEGKGTDAHPRECQATGRSGSKMYGKNQGKPELNT